MMNLSCDVIKALNGRTLATAESCTGGLIGGALTAVSGSSKVYKGGIISYTNEIKQNLLGVDPDILTIYGAVSGQTAQAMAVGAKKAMCCDFAVSTTGLAGPGGDEYGNPVGTVHVGIAGPHCVFSRHFLFSGDRESVRNQAVYTALQLLLQTIKEDSDEND